ncbi:MAG: hypothetical protein NTV22_02440, partial [bacterium]|nr:hypothetical protein [bacterium]
MNKTVTLLSVLVMAASLLWTGCGKAEKKPVAARQAEAPAVDISTLQEFLRYPGATATERVQISTEDSKGTA